MIRKATVSLESANTGKKEQLYQLLTEYNRCVNIFIKHLWDNEQFSGSFVKETNWVETWLSARLLQCASKQALSIVKSQRKKKKKVMPVFSKLVMDLDRRFIYLEQDSNSFDLWVTLSSLGGKLKLILPSKKHYHFNKFIGWNLKHSIKISFRNEKFLCDIYFEKESPPKKISGKSLAVDIGYKKLLVDSEKHFYGIDFEKLCNKISNRKQGSKAFKKALRERDYFVNKIVKELPLDKCKEIALELLKDVKKSSKLSKKFMNKLQRWVYPKVISRIKLTSEELGVQVIEVNPRNTSRTCPKCLSVDKASRNGEKFKCTSCNYVEDADYVGALNILRLGVQENMVPVTTES